MSPLLTIKDIMEKKWHFPVNKEEIFIYIYEHDKELYASTDIPIITNLDNFTGLLTNTNSTNLQINLHRYKNGVRAFSEEFPTISFCYHSPNFNIGSRLTTGDVHLFRYTWLNYKLQNKNNRFNDQFFHRFTGPAIIEYQGDELVVSQWWIKNNERTYDVRSFCSDNGLDVNNLSEQDKIILKMKFDT